MHQYEEKKIQGFLHNSPDLKYYTSKFKKQKEDSAKKIQYFQEHVWTI